LYCTELSLQGDEIADVRNSRASAIWMPSEAARYYPRVFAAV
jgi:hypothetical protein